MRKRTEDTPTMLYKYPGPHKIHGDKFDFIVVPRKDVEAKIAEGWRLTTPEAKQKVADEKADADAKAKADADAKAAGNKAGNK